MHGFYDFICFRLNSHSTGQPHRFITCQSSEEALHTVVLPAPVAPITLHKTTLSYLLAIFMPARGRRETYRMSFDADDVMLQEVSAAGTRREQG